MEFKSTIEILPIKEAKKFIALTPQEIHRMVETLLLIPDIWRILELCFEIDQVSMIEISKIVS